MAESVAEKVVRLETQMVDTKKQLDRVEIKLDGVINRLDDIAALQTKIDSLEDKIEEIQRKRVVYGWLFPTLAAAAGATLAILVEFALKNN